MALFAPQYNDHKLVTALKSISSYLFWTIAIFSIVPVLLPLLPQSGENTLSTYINILNITNIVCLVSYFALDIIVEYLLFPSAEDTRKADFIDNSWGTKNLVRNSEKYYDNEEIMHGIYKMAVNLFENSYFSYNVSRAMTNRKVVVSVIFGVAIFIIAYYGFGNVPIAVPLLQVVFSTVVLGDLVKHLIYTRRVKNSFEKWQNLFQYPEFKTDPDRFRADVYKNWLYYESTLARAQISLSESLFNAMNQRLTAEWEQLKSKYNI